MTEVAAVGRYYGDEPRLLDEGIAGAQEYTSLARLSSGGLIAVWQDNGFAVGQVFDAAGEKVGTEFQIAPSSWSPNVAALSTGGFVVGWSVGAGNNQYDIQARMFDAAGSAVGGIISVAQDSANDQLSPSLIGLSNGGFAASWTEGNLASAIEARFFNAAGVATTNDIVVASPGFGISSPTLSQLADGSVAIAYRGGTGPSGVTANINGRVYDLSGAPTGAIFTTNGLTDYSSAYGPQIVTLGSGNMALAWVAYENGTPVRLLAQIFTPTGAAVGSIIEVSSAVGPFTQVEIIATESGFAMAYVRHTSEDPFYPSATQPDIAVREFDGSGNPIGSEILINTVISGEQVTPSLAMFGSDDLAVSFTERGNSSGANVYIRLLYSTTPTSGNDLLNGTEGNDSISGLAGNDLIYGNGGDDSLNGGEDDDQIWGGGGDDLLDGGHGNDSLDGGEGNDVLAGGSGSDILIGGAGMDSTSYSGMFRSYQVQLNAASGSVTGGGEGGTDTLTGMERIQYQDGRFVFDVDSVASQVTRLYDAALRRAPDQPGLDLWVDSIEDLGGTLKSVAYGIFHSAEFQTKSGHLSDADYVEFLYQSALGRASDPDGKAHWVNKLANGEDRIDLLLGFSESPEHRGLTADLIAKGYYSTDDVFQAVAVLYGAMSGRKPDLGGLLNWVEALKSGAMSLDQVADGFANSEEFQDLITGFSNGDLVEFMYQNTLHRGSDPGGKAYWVGRLDAGMDHGDLLLGFASSNEHFHLLGASITNGIDYLL